MFITEQNYLIYIFLFICKNHLLKCGCGSSLILFILNFRKRSNCFLSRGKTLLLYITYSICPPLRFQGRFQSCDPRPSSHTYQHAKKETFSARLCANVLKKENWNIHHLTYPAQPRNYTYDDSIYFPNLLVSFSPYFERSLLLAKFFKTRTPNK